MFLILFHFSVDAERVIKAGGVYINHQRADQPDFVLIPGQHILPNGITLIRIGNSLICVAAGGGHVNNIFLSRDLAQSLEMTD